MKLPSIGIPYNALEYVVINPAYVMNADMSTYS